MMIVVIAATNPLSENRIMNARTTNRIEFVCQVARFGFLLALGVLALSALFATGAPVKTDNRSKPIEVSTDTTSLKPPDKGQIPVAFLISDGAVVIDFCGPWEVFQDVVIPSSEQMPFRLYTVAETKKPVRTSGGMQIVPEYTIENAPPPKVIVIPAQSQPSPAVLEWIRKSSKTTDVTMSVCTGAFVLAKTGLLNGKSATFISIAARALSRTEISQPPAVFLPGSISRSAWSNAITVARLPGRPLTTWNIREKAG